VVLWLAVVIHSNMATLPLVTIPLTLLMGWLHSPLYFGAFPELVTSIANARSCQGQQVPPLYHHTQNITRPSHQHFLESTMLFNTTLDRPPLAFHNIYIENFITVAQAPLQEYALRTLLHSIQEVFDSTPHPPRRLSHFIIKTTERGHSLLNFEAHSWWDIDTYYQMQISLLQHRLEALSASLQKNGTTYLGSSGALPQPFME
jgi:hypothetical protein